MWQHHLFARLFGTQSLVAPLEIGDALAILDVGADIRRTLSPQELEWLLGGNYIPLEFLPPQKIIQALSRSIYLGSQVDTIAESESSLLVLGESDFYAVESFG